MSYKCHKRYQNTRMLSDSITMHQFTSCISTDSNTKVNRHRLLYHSFEEGSGCLKKRKDKLQRSIVRIRKKKGGTLSVIRALSSHLSATRPGLSDRKEKKDIPPPTIYQGEEGIESLGCCRSAISRGTNALK